MNESTRLVDLVDSRIDEFLITRAPIVTLISSDLTPLVDFSRQFLSGGKRFRALFCYWGWQSVCGDECDDPTPVVAAAAALEIFHAAALIHDDIIDNSDTRRGGASAHKLFEGLHRSEGWAGVNGDFGRSSAILLGDLLLGWSDELLDEGLEALAARAPGNTDAVDSVAAGSGAAGRRARREFNYMRTEVTSGQYLDILEEQAWIVQPESELLERALRVITFKSAKYSVQAPLVIGAALAGGSPEQLDVLRAFGLPLGIAYQLRDDLLGVFGDASVTGKPSGDDLREGKRTVLVALARETLSASDRGLLDTELGDATLDATRIQVLQQLIVASGAVGRVEAMITERVAEAEAVLERAPLTTSARAQLLTLSARVTRRTF